MIGADSICLTEIKEVADLASSVLAANNNGSGLTTVKSTTVNSIADLYEAVKKRRITESVLYEDQPRLQQEKQDSTFSIRENPMIW